MAGFFICPAVKYRVFIDGRKVRKIEKRPFEGPPFPQNKQLVIADK